VTVQFYAQALWDSWCCRIVRIRVSAPFRVETLVRALVDHLAAFGGIPLVTVFDRPKTIALRWGRLFSGRPASRLRLFSVRSARVAGSFYQSV